MPISRFAALPCLALLLPACGAVPGDVTSKATDAADSPIQPTQPQDASAAVTHFANTEIIESSGVQRSQRLPGLLWLHNDSGAGPYLYATDSAGNDWGRVEVEGASFSDFEDIGGFEADGKSYLVVADIGDNAAGRASIQLYVFEEPPVESLEPGFQVLVHDYQRIETVYADGVGHDCESFAIDAKSDEVMLVTKSTGSSEPQELWTGSLSAALASGQLALQRQVAVTGIPAFALNAPPQLLALAASSATTGMDISPDRSEIAILTYGAVYVWARAAEENWAQALSSAPAESFTVPAAGNNQAEGIGYSPDGAWLLVAAENSLPINTAGDMQSGSTLSLIARR